MKAERFIAGLFEAYMKEPDMLPRETREQLDESACLLYTSRCV